MDVFEGTGLEELARRLGFGGSAVRTVLPEQQGSQWHDEMHRFMERYALENGTRSVELKGAKKLWYRTIQCTSGSCTCKYNYEGTVRNPLFNKENVTPFRAATEWLHQSHKVPRQEHFNQCVANVYARQADQAIPWHSDKMTCWGRQGTL